MFLLPSISYAQEAYRPFWGSSTAQSNFCEEDYVVTSYIAEFVNTLSNLAYIIFAWHRLSRAPTSQAPFAAKLPYYGLALVGVCSGLFHGTLKFYSQMSDDISMLIAAGCVLQSAMTYDKPALEAKRYTSRLLSCLVIVIVYHFTMDEVVVHQLTFAVLVLLVAIKTSRIIGSAGLGPNDKAILYRKTTVGAGCFVIGYLLWQLDHIFCHDLNHFKRQMGMPWSFVLEFHAYWHIFTAIGAYIFMVMVEELTQAKRRKL